MGTDQVKPPPGFVLDDAAPPPGFVVDNSPPPTAQGVPGKVSGYDPGEVSGASSGLGGAQSPVAPPVSDQQVDDYRQKWLQQPGSDPANYLHHYLQLSDPKERQSYMALLKKRGLSDVGMAAIPKEADAAANTSGYGAAWLRSLLTPIVGEAQLDGLPSASDAAMTTMTSPPTPRLREKLKGAELETGPAGGFDRMLYGSPTPMNAALLPLGGRALTAGMIGMAGPALIERAKYDPTGAATEAALMFGPTAMHEVGGLRDMAGVKGYDLSPTRDQLAPFLKGKRNATSTGPEPVRSDVAGRSLPEPGVQSVGIGGEVAQGTQAIPGAKPAPPQVGDLYQSPAGHLLQHVGENAFRDVETGGGYNLMPEQTALLKPAEYGISREIPNTPEGTVTGARNAVTEAERVLRGLEPEVTGKQWTPIKEAFDQGRDLVDNQGVDPRTLAATIATTKRPPTAAEIGALTYDRARIIAHDEALAREPVTEDVAKARADLADAFRVNDEALQRGGTEQSAAFNARKMLIGQDYSYLGSKMKAEKAKGAPLTPKEDAAIQGATTAVADAQAAINNKNLADANTVVEGAKLSRTDKIAALNDEFKTLMQDFVDKSSKLSAGLDPELVTAIGKIAVNRAKVLGLKTAELIDHVHAIIAEHRPDITRDQVVEAIAGSKRMEAYKARTKTAIENVGKPKPERTPVPKDAEARALSIQLEDAKARHAQATNLGDGHWSEIPVKALRFSILTGTKGLGKITAAAALLRPVTNQLDELAGGVLSKVPGISKIAKNAPVEGGYSPKAEVAAFRAAWSLDTLRDINRKVPLVEMLKAVKERRPTTATSAHSLDLEYQRVTGKQAAGVHRPEFADLPGLIHAGIKTMPQREAYHRALSKASDWEVRQGNSVAPGTPGEARAVMAAYDAGLRAILQQDNPVVNWWNNTLHQTITGTETNTVERGLARGLNFAARSTVPIVKVPTNFLGETGLYMGGGVNAGLRMALSKARGEMTPMEADYIMRALKKQTVGAALFATGYFGYKSVQGFYAKEAPPQKGHEEKEITTPFGTIPGNLTHSAALGALEAGATWRRLQESGKVSPPYGVGRGLIEELPFYREIEMLSQLKEGENAAGKVAGKYLSGWNPRAVQEQAERTDPLDKRARGPRGFVDTLKMTWPGKREEVPTKAANKARAAILSGLRH